MQLKGDPGTATRASQCCSGGNLPVGDDAPGMAAGVHVGKARGLRLIWILDLPELFRIAFWVSLKSRSDQW